LVLITKLMNILLPSMHPDVDEAFFLLSKNTDHNIYFLDQSWVPVIKYGLKYTASTKNRVTISYQEFLDTDIIDAVINPCFEQQNDVINNIINKKGSSVKYISYYGNEYHTGVINFNYFKNVLSANLHAYQVGKLQGVHSSHILLPVDYEVFQEAPEESLTVLNSYINSYGEFWAHSLALYSQCTAQFPNLDFRRYGVGEPNGYISGPNLYDSFKEEIATMHIKEKEGYGFATIQSLATGRPIIAFKPFVRGKTMERWITDETSIILESTAEFKSKLDRYLTDETYRHNLQHNAAVKIREIINFEEQQQVFNNFLEELI